MLILGEKFSGIRPSPVFSPRGKLKISGTAADLGDMTSHKYNAFTRHFLPESEWDNLSFPISSISIRNLSLLFCV